MPSDDSDFNLKPDEDNPFAVPAGDTLTPESVQPTEQQQQALESVATPKRLHASSLMFDIMSHGRTYLVPLALGLFGAASGEMRYLVISGFVFVPAVMISIFRYFTLRYRIEAQHLVVTQGLVFRQMRKVPVVRIQNIDLVQNILHRLLGVAEVRIETASGTEPEATLRVLSMDQLETLREAIFADRKRAVVRPASATDGLSAETPQSPLASDQPHDAAEAPVLRITIAELFKAGLASNRGLVMVGIALGAWFQFGDDGYRKQFAYLYDLLPQDWSLPTMIGVSIAAFVLVMVLLRLFGIGWYLLRFFGYRLDRRGDDFRISCGLFTRVSATVPRKRIQFISVHRPMLMRWFGLASIRIETAGGSGEKEDATQSVSKRWFIPVVAESRVAGIIETLRPGLQWQEDELEFQPLAPRAFSRMSRIAIVKALLIGAIGLLVTRPWGVAAGIVALPLLLMWARRQARSMRYARTAEGVLFRSGVLNRKISITFFDKIQAMRVDQSPFDRRWSMAKLTVDTAAAGPAGHSISVPFLDAEFALAEFEQLRDQTGQYRPVFQ